MPWGGVRIAVRLSALRRANVWFTTLFGGGCLFPSGEDSMWLTDAKRAGLTFYVSQHTIGFVSFATSTWFTGADDRFYYGKGAFYAAMHPHTFGLWSLYFAWRTRKSSQLSFREKQRWMRCGRKGYRSMQRYEDFIQINQKQENA